MSQTIHFNNPFFVLQIQSGTSEWADRETFGREPEAIKAFDKKVEWRHVNPQARATHWRLVRRTQDVICEI